MLYIVTQYNSTYKEQSIWLTYRVREMSNAAQHPIQLNIHRQSLVKTSFSVLPYIDTLRNKIYTYILFYLQI